MLINNHRHDVEQERFSKGADIDANAGLKQKYPGSNWKISLAGSRLKTEEDHQKIEKVVSSVDI